MFECPGDVLFDAAHRDTKQAGDLGLFHLFEAVEHEYIPGTWMKLGKGHRNTAQLLLSFYNALRGSVLTDCAYAGIVAVDGRAARAQTPASVAPEVNADTKDVPSRLIYRVPTGVCQCTRNRFLGKVLCFAGCPAAARKVTNKRRPQLSDECSTVDWYQGRRGRWRHCFGSVIRSRHRFKVF